MTRFLYVDGDDITSLVRHASLQFVEAAYGCDVGQGGFDWDDDVLGDVPAMKAIRLEEMEATPTLAFRGYVGQRAYERGVRGKVQNQRQLDVEALDLNTLWDDPVLEGTDANRPAETDYARMTWLIGTDEFAALGISAGVVPNTNTVNMEKRDYRGEQPRLVAEECMEEAKKNAFLYDYGAGFKVYYDLATGTSLSSSARISSVLADVDEASLVFASHDPKLRKDPTRVYSKVRFEYAGGHVSVTDAGTEAEFRARAVTVRDDNVKNATRATNKANAYLDRADTEQKIYTVSTTVPAESLNTIRAGQRLEVKLPHLEIADWTWMRIARRTIYPQRAGDGGVWDRYRIDLEFAEDLRPAGFGGRGDDDGDDASIDDDAAVSFARYQLTHERGGGPFGPAAGLWDSIAEDFSFGSLSSTTTGTIEKSPEHNVPWPYTDCGVGTGAVGGLEVEEAWFRFTADLSDSALVGVHVTVDALANVSGMASGSGTIIVGLHTGASSSGAELTTEGEYVEVGRVGSSGGEVTIPASLLIDVTDGYNWIVLAPGWEISSGLLICNSAGSKPEGHAETGAATGGDAPLLVHATTTIASGSGLSPWLPAMGDVDGSNGTFSIPLWNGEGVPELRVGTTVLAPGEFTYDADALTVTITPAPPEDMAGQVAYRAQMG